MIVVFVLLSILTSLIYLLTKSVSKSIAISLFFFVVSALVNKSTGIFDILFWEVDDVPCISDKKEEAIKRNSYVCDIKLPYTPYKVNDTLVLTIKEGWIEKKMCGGRGYKKTIDEGGYRLHMVVDTMNSSKHDWEVYNINSGVRHRQGFYQNTSFLGILGHLPETDTIKYNVMKEHIVDYSEKNILGRIEFVLVRK